MKILPKGFTLPEMLVVVFLTAVVGGALMTSINFFYRDNAYVFSEVSAVADARRSVADVLATVREATYGADGSYPLEEVEENRIVLHADSDNDGIVERIEYYLEEDALWRAVTVPEDSPYMYDEESTQTKVMAAHVSASSTALFRYVGQGGTELTAPVDATLVRSVDMHLSIIVGSTLSSNPLVLEGSATLRNVRN